MALCTLWLTDGSFKRVEPDKALHYWEILKGRVEPTEEEAGRIMYIKDIFIAPTYRPSDYHETHEYARPNSGLPETHRAETSELKPDPQEQAIENGTDFWNN